MNILNIHTYQGMQNATRPAGESNTAASDRTPSSVTSSSSDSFPGDIRKGVVAQIDSLQKHVEGDLNIVRDPPFFPIATYQRADLIKRIRVIEEEIQRSTPPKIKSTLSSPKLKEGATDTEIASALDKLFAFRDQVKSGGTSSLPKTGPGSILAVEA